MRNKKYIERLERMLDEANEKNERLQQQLVLLVDKPTVLPIRGKPAEVTFMDDERIVELEESGNAPT